MPLVFAVCKPFFFSRGKSSFLIFISPNFSKAKLVIILFQNTLVHQLHKTDAPSFEVVMMVKMLLYILQKIFLGCLVIPMVSFWA